MCAEVHYIGADENNHSSHDEDDVANSGASTDITVDDGREGAGREIGATLGSGVKGGKATPATATTPSDRQHVFRVS